MGDDLDIYNETDDIQCNDDEDEDDNGDRVPNGSDEDEDGQCGNDDPVRTIMKEPEYLLAMNQTMFEHGLC